MKEIFKRYLVFVIGLYFLAAGIVLIIRSALGTTPISSINYVLSLNSPFVVGYLHIYHQHGTYPGTILVNPKE